MDEWKRIRQVIKGGDAVLAAVSEAIAERLPLAPEDADLLARLDAANWAGVITDAGVMPADHVTAFCDSLASDAPPALVEQLAQP